jgi:hypothetical protein
VADSGKVSAKVGTLPWDADRQRVIHGDVFVGRLRAVEFDDAIWGCDVLAALNENLDVVGDSAEAAFPTPHRDIWHEEQLTRAGVLHLPTVRTEVVRLAEIADRERQTHLRYFAEVLAAEVDDRTVRRRSRRINDAKFPRLKRLADFNNDAVASIAPAILGQLAGGHYMDAGEPVALLGDSGAGKSHLLIRLGLAACDKAAGSATSPPRNWSTNSSRPPTNASCPASWPATGA